MRKMLLSVCAALAVLGCAGDMDELPPCLTCVLCGSQEYTYSEFCFEGKIYPKCNRSDYNPSRQFCLGGSVYSKCGGSDYNPSVEFCSEGTIYPKCGEKTYSPSTQECCNNNKIYSIETEFCSGSTVYSKCGGMDYNLSTEFCSEGTVYQASVKGNNIGNYRTVVIGTQTWMAENLDYNVEGSRCYGNNAAYCNTYGRLYDWATAMALPSSCNSDTCSSQIQSPHRGICPSGWHIPSFAERTTLVSFVGSPSGTKLKSASGWNDYQGASGNGTDEFSFSALPGGNGNSDGSFSSVGFSGAWWSATEGNAYDAYPLNMNYNLDYVFSNFYSKSYLRSVRCVQDYDFACAMTATTGWMGVPITPAPAVTCNGVAVTAGLTWTPANLTPTTVGSVPVSVSAGSGACSGLAAQCGSVDVSDVSTYSGKGNSISSYKTVVIGTQTWMAENLDYVVEGSKCYNNDPANCTTYGSLYNWATAMALPSSCTSTSCSSQINSPHRGICPSGWHIPSHSEWTTLTDYVGGASTAGRKLKATSGWNDYQGASGNGTDEFGFSALPSGNDYSNGSFVSVGSYGNWWSATELSANYAYSRHMNYNGDYVGYGGNYKSSLYSVRCVQDGGEISSSSAPPSSSSIAPSSSSAPTFACAMTATTGTVGLAITPAPAVTCNGVAVTAGLAWTPASLIPTAAGSVPVSVSASSGVCSGMVAQCGSITVSPPTFACAMTVTTGTVGAVITPAPAATCNGVAVAAGDLAWTPANLTPTAAGSVSVSVVAGSGVCSGMAAQCGSVTVSAPIVACPVSAISNGSVTCGGQTYKTVIIGTQTWMAENLNYNPGAGNSVCYENQTSNCVTYGRLYDWSTAMNLPSNCNSTACSGYIQSKHHGICPDGWHLPSDAEWDVLVTFAGGSSAAGTKLKATSGWNSFYNVSGNGTNEYGFSALPGGYGDTYGGFLNVGNEGRWWSTNESSGNGSHRAMSYRSDNVFMINALKSYPFSVRCVQD